MNKIERLIQEKCKDGIKYLELGKICEIKGRIGFRGYKKEDQVEKGQGAISLSPSNINNGVIDYNNCTYINWDKYYESPEIMVNDNDIIFTKTASVGKVALIKGLPEKSTINPQLVLLKNIKCNSSYLYYVLSTNEFQNKVMKIKGLGTIPTISQQRFEKLTVPVPPMEVQDEIVHVLDNFMLLSAELSAELKTREKQYNYYKDKLFLELKDVKKYKLNEIAQIYDGTHQTPKYTNNGVSFISVENISDIYNSKKYISFEDYNKYKIKPKINDIFMTRIGSIGKCSVYDKEKDLAYYVSLALIRPNNSIVNSYYLKFLIESIIGINELRKRTLVNAVPIKVNKDDIGKIELPIPNIQVQERIVNILSRFDRLCNDISEGLPAEIEKRQIQYEYYRNKLLTFKELVNEG